MFIPDPSRGRRIPTRYFKVDKPDEYYQENLPAEWDCKFSVIHLFVKLLVATLKIINCEFTEL